MRSIDLGPGCDDPRVRPRCPCWLLTGSLPTGWSRRALVSVVSKWGFSGPRGLVLTCFHPNLQPLRPLGAYPLTSLLFVHLVRPSSHVRTPNEEVIGCYWIESHNDSEFILSNSALYPYCSLIGQYKSHD